MKKTILTIALLIGGLFCAKAQNDIDLVIGTYGEHLYIYNLDCKTLEFTLKAKAEAKNASYALAEAGQILAVSEVGEGSGAYSFQVNAAADKTTADRAAEILSYSCFMALSSVSRDSS